jgi:CHAT domain-containing protein
MLSEIEPSAMQGCELALLSACRTNVGPHQRGEGVWAMSRGFLSAGCRRVVATNWNVDDQAAQSLVRRFADLLAGSLQHRQGDFATVEYARSLHAAKQCIRRGRDHEGRDYPQWKKPAYWAAFQLMGYK